MRSASASTSGRSFSTLTVKRWSLLLEVRAHLPADPLRPAGRTEVGFGSMRSLPASLRARSRRSLIIFWSCAELSAITSAASNWRVFSDSPLRGEHLGESLDHRHRRAQLVRDGEHEVVLHPLDPVAFARVPLEGVRHLVEGPAEGRDLDGPPDLDSRPQVAAREPPGPLDQAAERRPHRVDQSGEEDQRGEQRPCQARRHQQGGVARLAARVVAGGVTRVPRRRWPAPRRCWSRPRSAGARHRAGGDLPVNQRLGHRSAARLPRWPRAGRDSRLSTVSVAGQIPGAIDGVREVGGGPVELSLARRLLAGRRAAPPPARG